MMTYAERYYQMGQVIRDTVKEAQENMANIGRQIEDWPEWMPLYGPLDWESYCFGLPFQYPQSLGELCLEVYSDLCRPYGFNDWPIGSRFTPGWKDDAMALRRLLYHKSAQLKESNRTDCPGNPDLIPPDTTTKG